LKKNTGTFAYKISINKMKGKYLLIYSYSAKNAGDLAITLGALDLLSKINGELITVSRYSANDIQFQNSSVYLKNRYPDIEIFPAPFELNRGASRIGLYKQYFAGFLKLFGLKKDEEFKALIKSCDVVYCNGGNLMRCESITDFIRLNALIYPLKVACKANVPIIILPQSTSEINLMGRVLLKSILNKAKMIYCREGLTFHMFKKYFPKSSLCLNTDLAFFIEHQFVKKKNNIRKIAITTRSHKIGDIGDFSESKKLRIKNQLIKISLELLRRGFHVCYVVQSQNDLMFTRDIYDFFAENGYNVSFFENYDPVKLIEFYSTCDLLLGMRLHSIILALNAGTPCIGFFDESWGLKNPGILKTFDLPYYFIEDEIDVKKFIEDLEGVFSLENQNNNKRAKLIDDFKSSFVLSDYHL